MAEVVVTSMKADEPMAVGTAATSNVTSQDNLVQHSLTETSFMMPGFSTTSDLQITEHTIVDISRITQSPDFPTVSQHSLPDLSPSPATGFTTPAVFSPDHQISQHSIPDSPWPFAAEPLQVSTGKFDDLTNFPLPGDDDDIMHENFPMPSLSQRTLLDMDGEDSEAGGGDGGDVNQVSGVVTFIPLALSGDSDDSAERRHASAGAGKFVPLELDDDDDDSNSLTRYLLPSSCLLSSSSEASVTSSRSGLSSGLTSSSKEDNFAVAEVDPIRRQSADASSGPLQQDCPGAGDFCPLPLSKDSTLSDDASKSFKPPAVESMLKAGLSMLSPGSRAHSSSGSGASTPIMSTVVGQTPENPPKGKMKLGQLLRSLGADVGHDVDLPFRESSMGFVQTGSYQWKSPEEVRPSLGDTMLLERKPPLVSSTPYFQRHPPVTSDGKPVDAERLSDSGRASSPSSELGCSGGGISVGPATSRKADDENLVVKMFYGQREAGDFVTTTLLTREECRLQLGSRASPIGESKTDADATDARSDALRSSAASLEPPMNIYEGRYAQTRDEPEEHGKKKKVPTATLR